MRILFPCVVFLAGQQDHVHFLTYCDVIVASGNSTSAPAGGLSCTPVVTHADGRPVSAILPATAGEELIAYATGLGETNPALTTGQPASASNPTVTTFGIDFNCRANALATKPLTNAIAPLFTGASNSSFDGAGICVMPTGVQPSSP